jgi:hypothetical protein
MGVMSRIPVPGSGLGVDPAPRGPDRRGEQWAIVAGLMVAVFLTLVLLYIVVPSPSADTGAQDNSMEVLRYLFGR